MGMVNDFYLGNLDIKRLYYGVITLVPKVKYANDVKQFRPICLLNVSFKIFTKLMMDRLTGVVAVKQLLLRGDTYLMVRLSFMKPCMNFLIRR